MNEQNTHLALRARPLLRKASLMLLLLLATLLYTRTAQAQSANDGFNPAANGTVHALVVQADGNILVGGDFTDLGGQARNRIGRLSSAVPALYNNLDAISDGIWVTWQRSMAAPEVMHVTFEWSTDGLAYSLLGNGVRAREAWRLDGLALPHEQDIYLRARAYDGVSVFESVRLVYLQPPNTLSLYLPVVVRTGN